MRDLDFTHRPVAYSLKPPPPASANPSVMTFSFAKAGSTLLYNMLRKLAPAAGLTYYSPEDALFAGNIGPNNRPTDVGDTFRPTGYCYGGFRSYPPYRIPILTDVPIVFLVRDPRDMAVSIYYSLLVSHSLPDEAKEGSARQEMLRARQVFSQVGIDAYVLNSATMQYKRMFESYAAAGFLWRPNVTIYRYEDVIFSKADWLRSICRVYGWNMPDARIEAIAAEFDERPQEARPDQHVRNVTPGDHKKQLAPKTIEGLNEAFKEYLGWFGYS